MFAEANSTDTGLVDASQLAKAVGGQFPHRSHNDDWFRLFELALDPQAGRLSALPSSPPLQQPIRAIFEQEREMLTFSPRTNVSRGYSVRRRRLQPPALWSGVRSWPGDI